MNPGEESKEEVTYLTWQQVLCRGMFCREPVLPRNKLV